MAEILGRILMDLLASLIAKGVGLLPPKVQRILGALLLTLLIAPTCWCLTISTLQLNLEDALSHGEITLLLSSIITFLLIYFIFGSVQNRRDKHDIQNQFTVVRDLLRERRYEQAKAVLATINHPKTRQWEAKLRDITPNEPDFLQQLQ